MANHDVKEDIKKNQITFSNIYHILEKELNYSTISELDIEDIAIRILNKAKIKDIYGLSEDVLDNEDDIKRQVYEILIPTTSGKRVKEKTKENYVELNAIHKAEVEAIEELNKSGRLPSLDRFLNSQEKK